MKKFFRVFLVIFLLLIISILVFPSFYKNKIKELILNEFEKSVDGTLYFSNVNLSLIKNFPDMTVSLEEVGIIGKGVFESDTLMHIDDLSLTVDLSEIIGGEEMNVKTISMENPNILIMTLADGSANYDIAKAAETPDNNENETDTDPNEASIGLGLQGISISGGEFVYYDQLTEVFTQLDQINLTGEGNFENDVFDLITKGSLRLVDLNYAGADYMENKDVNLDVTLGMDLANSTYTFKQNQFQINNFPIHADGSVAMKNNGYGLDLSFDAPNATFAQLLSLVPGMYANDMEGLTSKGNLTFGGALKGEYSDETMPAFNFNLSVSDASFSYSGYPEKIDEFQLDLEITNGSGVVESTSIVLDNLAFKVDNSPFETKLSIANLKDYDWDLEAKGALDLELVNTLFPQEGVTIAGGINSDIHSKGNLKLIEQEAYEELPFRGNLSLNNFEYRDPEMIDLTLDKTELSFDNNAIQLISLQGKTKSTSFQASGEIRDFIGFALGEGTLKGTLNAKADKVNIAEWMTTGESEADESSDSEETYEESLSADIVRIPKNIQFDASVDVDELVYNQLVMNDAKGRMIVKEGIVSFNNTGLKALNGNIGLNGTFDSQAEKPKFDFGLDLQNLSIPNSFASVNTVQAFAPVAEQMTGLFNSNFRISGVLNDDFYPDLSVLSGSGIIEVLQASLGDSDILSGLSGVTKLANVASATLDKVKMSAEIKNGRLFVKPFNVRIGDYQSKVFGSTGIDGTIDYNLAIDVPSGKVGNQVNSLISSFTGSNQSFVGDNLVMTVGMIGNFKKPSFRLKSVSSAEGETIESQIKSTVKAEAEARIDSAKQIVTTKIEDAKDSASTVIEAKKDSLISSADSLFNAKKDTLIDAAASKLGLKSDSTKNEVDKVKDKAKSALKGLLRKKKKKDN